MASRGSESVAGEAVRREAVGVVCLHSPRFRVALGSLESLSIERDRFLTLCFLCLSDRVRDRDRDREGDLEYVRRLRCLPGRSLLRDL